MVIDDVVDAGLCQAIQRGQLRLIVDAGTEQLPDLVGLLRGQLVFLRRGAVEPVAQQQTDRYLWTRQPSADHGCVALADTVVGTGIGGAQLAGEHGADNVSTDHASTPSSLRTCASKSVSVPNLSSKAC